MKKDNYNINKLKKISILKKEKGITLMALIVTIIVLLILAGVAIKLMISDDEPAQKAQWAKFVTEYRNVEELERLYEYENVLNKSYTGSVNIDIDKFKESNIIASKKIATTEDIAVNTLGVEYAVTDKAVGVNVDLGNYIYGLENDEFPRLYEVDSTKLNIAGFKDKYAININSGKLYDVTGLRYKGLMYYTPDYGMNKKGELIKIADNNTDEDPDGQLDDDDDEQNKDDEDTRNSEFADENKPDKMVIHYLPGYEGETEKVETYQSQNVVTVSGNKFNRDSYYFVGWKIITSKYTIDEITEQEVEEADIDGIPMDEPTEEDEIIYPGDELCYEGVAIYLEAVWTQNTVELDSDGGNLEELPDNVFPVIPGKTYDNLPEPEKDGYVFGGWHTDKDSFTDQVTPDDPYRDNVKKLYAYWVIDTDPSIATVTFNPNGGTCTVNEKKVVKGKRLGALPGGSKTKKTTYKYDCWTLSDKETKVKGSYVITGDITLYARYTIHMYYDYQGGTGKYEYKNVKIGGYRGFIYNGAKKDGYKVQAWYTRRNGQGDKVVFWYKINQTNDFIIYANWLKKCTVTYNLNCEDTGLTTPKNKYRYQTAKIGWLSRPKRTNYKFIGWYKEPSCITKVESSYVMEDDITLYAKWEQQSHIVQYKMNDGTSNVFTTQTKLQGKNLTVTSSTPTRTGYTFLGWGTSSSSATVTYTAGSTYSRDQTGGTYNLYAVWKSAAVVSSTYYTYGGTFSNVTVRDNYFQFDFKGTTGQFEKLNIRIPNLVANQQYRISFTCEYNGSFNSKYYFGCKMSSSTVTGTSSSSVLKNMPVDYGRTTGTRNSSFTFTATGTEMYWVWDFSALKDGTFNTITFSNVTITPI